MKAYKEARWPFDRIDAVHGWAINGELIGAAQIGVGVRRWSASRRTLYVDYAPVEATPALREDAFRRYIYNAVTGYDLPPALGEETVGVFPRECGGTVAGVPVSYPLRKQEGDREARLVSIVEFAHDVRRWFSETGRDKNGYSVARVRAEIACVYGDHPAAIKPAIAALWGQLECAALDAPVLINCTDASRHFRRHSRGGKGVVVAHDDTICARYDPDLEMWFFYDFRGLEWSVPFFAAMAKAGGEMDWSAIEKALGIWASIGRDGVGMCYDDPRLVELRLLARGAVGDPTPPVTDEEVPAEELPAA